MKGILTSIKIKKKKIIANSAEPEMKLQRINYIFNFKNIAT